MVDLFVFFIFLTFWTSHCGPKVLSYCPGHHILLMCAITLFHYSEGYTYPFQWLPRPIPSFLAPLSSSHWCNPERESAQITLSLKKSILAFGTQDFFLFQPLEQGQARLHWASRWRSQWCWPLRWGGCLWGGTGRISQNCQYRRWCTFFQAGILFFQACVLFFSSWCTF